MNIHLDSFELHFDESLVLQGSDLYAKQAVSQMKSIQRNLYEFVVNDWKDHVVEILSTRKNVKKFSCDCGQFHEQKHCAHLIAALFSLRVALSDSKKKSKPATPKNRILTINAILESTSEDQIKSFLKTQARKNKALSFALKTRFITQVEMEQGVNKYELLLSELIKIDKRGRFDLSKTDQKLLNNIALSLIENSSELIVFKRYREASQLFLALLLKLHSVVDKIPDIKEELPDTLKKAYQNLNKFLTLNIAPELRQEICTGMLELASRSTYKVPSYYENVFQSFPLVISEHEKVEEMMELLKMKICQNTDENQDFAAQLIWLPMNAGLPVDWPFIFSHCTENEVMHLHQNLYNNKAYDVLSILGKQYLNQQLSPKFRRTCLRYLFEASVALKQDNGILVYGTELLLAGESTYFILNFLEVIPNPREPKLMKIIARIEEELAGFQKEKLLTFLFAETHMYTQLFKCLADAGSLELFLEYIKIYFREDRDGAEKLLTTLTLNYLNEYIGSKATKMITKVFYHLHQLGQEETARNIQSKIEIKFPERISLSRSFKRML